MPTVIAILFFSVLYRLIVSAETELQDGSTTPTNWTSPNSSAAAPFKESVEGRSLASSCAFHLCQNGGICTWSENRIICLCSGGYSGKYCEVQPQQRFSDVCSVNTCHNGGRCQAYSGPAYTCICTAPFYGPNCKEKRTTSVCFPNPCFNGGRCLMSPHGGFQCSCSTLYTGARCEIFVGKRSCQEISCMNGGTCTRTPTGFTCYCPHGFVGQICESRKVDLCTPSPCSNGGICVESPYGATGNSYRCVCPQGYTGIRCEKHNREVAVPESTSGACAANPCKGDCRCYESCRHSSGYYCRSPSGFLGKDCSIPPPVLRCESNLVSVVLDDSFVREYEQGEANIKVVMAQTANSVTRASKDCQASFDGNQYTFSLHLPFASCGTKTTRSADGSAVFSNNVWLNRILGGGFDMPVPVVSFECAYQKEYTIVTALQPSHSQPLVIQESGKIILEGTIDLCKVQTACPQICPAQFSVTQGAVYTVGEMIHLTIRKAKADLQTIVALQDLFITCDGSTRVIDLVQNGCAAGSVPSVITHSGVSSSVCASFQVPKLQNCNNFYIHAKLESCSETGCVTPSPELGCTARGRKRRHLDETKIKVIIGSVIGPIHAIRGSDGIPHEVLFPGRELVDFDAQIIDHVPTDKQRSLVQQGRIEEGAAAVDTTMLLIAVGSFCVVVTVLVFLALQYFAKCKESRSC